MLTIRQDISKVTITGLRGKTYIDRTDQSAQHVESSPSISITSETDRIYKSYKPDGVVVVHEDGNPRFEIMRDTLGDVVVWNPWSEKAKGMSDFGPADGYKQMGMSQSLQAPHLSPLQSRFYKEYYVIPLHL